MTSRKATATPEIKLKEEQNYWVIRGLIFLIISSIINPSVDIRYSVVAFNMN